MTRSIRPIRAAVDRHQPLVLVVDDSDDNRDLYSTYFEYEGFIVGEARDGEEALASVDSDPPDAIVMDLSMPRVDGWEATRLLKSNPKTSGIWIIVVTGNATAAHLDRARAAGADAVRTKPCPPGELADLVRKGLGERGKSWSRRDP